MVKLDGLKLMLSLSERSISLRISTI